MVFPCRGFVPLRPCKSPRHKTRAVACLLTEIAPNSWNGSRPLILFFSLTGFSNWCYTYLECYPTAATARREAPRQRTRKGGPDHAPSQILRYDPCQARPQPPQCRKSTGPRTPAGKHRGRSERTHSGGLVPEPRAKRRAKPTEAKPVKTIIMNKIRIKEKKRSQARYHLSYQGLTGILPPESGKYGWIGSVLLRIRDRRASGSKPTGSEANRSQAS